MKNLLDFICGIHKYSTDSRIAVYAEMRNVNDFVVEEILRDGTVLTVDNPKLKHSGYTGLFTHFVLVKKNLDTFVALRILSRRLGVPPHLIFLSGLKDKEAITVQRACVFGIPPDRLERIELPSKLRIFSPIRELRRVFIGDHWGNRFTVRLWYVRGPLNNIVDTLSKQPLLNFYGHQRFGLWKPINHIVGKMILQKRYEDALIVFLREINPLFRSRNLFLDLLEDKKYDEALSLLPPKKFWFERYILKEFSRGRSADRILRRIPLSLLRLMVEAYQSFIFNLLLSELESPPPKLPLVGYRIDNENMNGSTRKILNEILDAENILPKLFRMKNLKLEITRGGFRRSIIRVKDVAIFKNKYHYVIRFSLPKGSFATIVLREIVKENLLWLLLGRKRSQYGGLIRLCHDMLVYYKKIISRYYVGRHLKNFAT